MDLILCVIVFALISLGLIQLAKSAERRMHSYDTLSAEMFVQTLACLLMPLMLRQRDKSLTVKSQSFEVIA